MDKERLEQIKNNAKNHYFDCDDRYQGNKDFNWLMETVEEQQKENVQFKDQADLYKRKLISEQRRLENLRKDFFELSAYCVDRNKNIDYLLKEKARLEVVEQTYEAMKKAL